MKPRTPKNKEQRKPGTPLKNIKHEAVAQKLARQILDPKEPKPSVTQAYRDVYKVSQESAEAVSYRVLENVGVRNRVHEILNSAGITVDKLAKKHAQLLEAKRGIYFEGTRIGEEEDNTAQNVALNTGYKVLQVLSDQPITDNRSIQFTIDPSSLSQLNSIIANMRVLRDNTEQHTAQPSIAS